MVMSMRLAVVRDARHVCGQCEGVCQFCGTFALVGCDDIGVFVERNVCEERDVFCAGDFELPVEVCISAELVDVSRIAVGVFADV